jgi:hypothetical protein
MSVLRAFAFAAVLAALSGPAHSQDAPRNTDPANISPDRAVLFCHHLQNPAFIFPEQTKLYCGNDGNFTFEQIYTAGWRVAAYTTTDHEGPRHHHFVFDRARP